MMAHTTQNGVRAGRLAMVTAGVLGALLSAAALRAADPPKGGGKGTEMVQLINEAIQKGWDDNKITPSQPCGDYTFIRRASLDIIGRIATPKEVADYMAQPQASRRSWLIDKLLDHSELEYERHWANLWSNWLLTRSGPFGGRSDYHKKMSVWLEDQFSLNLPLNQLLTKLVTAKGKNTDSPEVNFMLAHVGEPIPQNLRGEQGQFDMVPLTSRITRVFLGTQTQCAQCHDHPFDARIKQQDFWGINAFLRQVERKGNPPMVNNNNAAMAAPMLELVINTGNNGDGYVSYEKRNGVILKTKPVFFTKGKPADLTADRRDELAKFVVDHPMFGKAFVNRMWAHFMGRGFTNPIDDFNDQNQPSNPELLETLGEKFVHYGYDTKNVIRWICNSKPYHLSSVANKTNDKSEADPFFARMQLKVMSPEELFESISTAAVTDQGKEAKADQRSRWLQNLVANFGDDEGNEVNYNGTVVQALLMMNGTDINTTVSDANGLVAKLMTKYKVTNNNLTPQAQIVIINDLYMSTLNRPPTDGEKSAIVRNFPLAKEEIVNKKPVLVPIPEKEVAWRFQDLLWALINSNEFMLNH